MPIVYKVVLPQTCCELILPSLNDIKCLVIENEELLDLLLLKQVDIISETVDISSKKYQTAMKNAVIRAQ